jgi:hypothetical protein
MMKSGLSRSHWKLDKRLVALVVALFVIATAVYVYVGLHSPLRQ